MSEYPRVKGEVETIHKILDGYSIARFGDGELAVSQGTGYTRETPKAALSKELRRVLKEPLDNLIIGIPTMDPKGSKYDNWKRHLERYKKIIPHNREYYSAFITRPDCCPWMRNKEYALLMQSIWEGKRLTFVGSEIGRNKFQKVLEATAAVDIVEAPWRDAYDQIDNLKEAVIAQGNELVILSHGVSATCLAFRLAKTGKFQALDLGSVGGFLVKMLLSGDKYER